MPIVKLRHENESFESLLKRWKRLVEKDKLLRELKKREFYEKPSITKTKTKAAAVKRWKRQLESEKEEMEELRRTRKKGGKPTKEKSYNTYDEEYF